MKNIEKIIKILASELRHTDNCHSFRNSLYEYDCVKCEIEELMD